MKRAAFFFFSPPLFSSAPPSSATFFYCSLGVEKELRAPSPSFFPLPRVSPPCFPSFSACRSSMPPEKQRAGPFFFFLKATARPLFLPFLFPLRAACKEADDNVLEFSFFFRSAGEAPFPPACVKWQNGRSRRIVCSPPPSPRRPRQSFPLPFSFPSPHRPTV